MKFTKISALLLAFLLALGSLTGCLDTVSDVLDIGIALLDETEPDFVDSVVKEIPDEPASVASGTETEPDKPDESGSYYSKEDVALYLWTYKKLPANFITKAEAQKLGWEGGSVEKYKAGAAIGGDRFGNYEALLPKDKSYRECDIDTDGASSRGAKRIVYAEDFSAVYYTDDHYESFTRIYPAEG